MTPKQTLTILLILSAAITGCTSTRPIAPKLTAAANFPLISNPKSNRAYYSPPTKLDSLKPMLQAAGQQAAAKADSLGRITHPWLFQPLFIIDSNSLAQ